MREKGGGVPHHKTNIKGGLLPSCWGCLFPPAATAAEQPLPSPTPHSTARSIINC